MDFRPVEPFHDSPDLLERMELRGVEAVGLGHVKGGIAARIVNHACARGGRRSVSSASAAAGTSREGLYVLAERPEVVRRRFVRLVGGDQSRLG